MADINDTPGEWVGVLELTTDTLVDAGEDGQGPANAQARALAKRTQYLKELVEQNQQTISDHDDAIVSIQGEVDGIKNGQFWVEESADFTLSLSEFAITRVRVSTLANPVVGTLPVSFPSDGIGIIFTDQDDTWDTNVFKLEIPAGATYSLEGAVEESPGVYRLTLSDKGALAYVIYDSSEDKLIVNTSATGGGSSGGGGLTLSGQWDMTGVATEAVPLEADNVACTVQIVDANTQRVTPVAPLFNLGTAFASTVFSQPLSSLTGSAKYLQHTPDVGDNLIGFQLGLVQTGKTLIELLTELTAPTPGVYGIIFQSISGQNSITVIQDGVSNVEQLNGFALQPSDRLYLITDEDSNTVSYQVNDGPLIPVTIPGLNLPSWPQMRVFYNSLFLASTPVLANGYTTLDMGASDGGRTPYQDVADAILPAGAEDGKAYEVTGPGKYNGVRGYQGDIAVFYNSTSDIFLIRNIDTGSTASKNDLILVQQEVDEVSRYKGVKRIESFVTSPIPSGATPGLLYACSPDPSFTIHQDLIDAGLSHGDLFTHSGGVYTKYTPYPGERFVFSLNPSQFVIVYLPPYNVNPSDGSIYREMRTLRMAPLLSNDLVRMADYYFYPEEDNLDEYTRKLKRVWPFGNYETVIDPSLLKGGIIVVGNPINFRAPVYGKDLNRRLRIDMSLGFGNSNMIDIDPLFNSVVEVDTNSSGRWSRFPSSTLFTLGVSQRVKWAKFSPEGKYIVSMGIGSSRMSIYRQMSYQPILITNALPSDSYPPIGKACMYPFVAQDTTLWAASCGNLTGYEGMAPNGNLYRIDYTTGDVITTVTDQGWGLIRDFSVDYQKNKIFIVSGNGLWEYNLSNANVTQLSTDTNFNFVTAGKVDNLLVNDYFYTARSSAPYVERWKISDYSKEAAPGVTSAPLSLQLSPDGVYLACGSQIIDADTLSDTDFAVNSYGRTRRAFWLPMT